MKDSSYRWVILGFGLLFQAMTFGLVFYSFAVMVIPFQETFTVSLQKIMIATIFLQLGLGVFSAILGKNIDIWKPHYFVASGGVAMALGFIICAIASNYIITLIVYATLFPLGLVLAGSLAAQSLAIRWFPKKRGFALGVSAMGTSLGGLLMPPMVVTLNSLVGWQSAYFLIGIASVFIICPLAWFLLRRMPLPIDTKTESTSIEAYSWTTKQVLSQPIFWACVLGFSPIIASFTAIQLNIAAYAYDIGFDASSSAFLVSIIALTMIVGKLFFASMSDHISHGLLFCIVVLGHIIVICLMRLPLDFTQLAFVMAIFGFSVGGVLPLAGIFIVHAFGASSFGRAMGLFTPFVAAASAIGPIISASIRDSSGTYTDAFFPFLFILVPAVLIVIRYFGIRPPTQSRNS